LKTSTSWYEGGVSKQTIVIELAGSKYRITSDANEAHLQRLAQMVNQRIDDLGPRASRTASPAQVLAIVALGLADDLMAAEERRKRIEEVTRRTIADAIARIDHRLRSDAVSVDPPEPRVEAVSRET
jgi:cell division protein ZapA (FtsZ GTPase activity inhibitor)